MSKSKYDRRLFLKALGVSAAFLPMLDTEFAKAEGKAPRRMVAMIWPNGVTSGGYWPSGGESNFQMSEVLSPLTPHRDKILILDSINCQSLKDQFNNKKAGHASMPFLLTGGNAKEVGDASVGNSISVDQHVANALKTSDPTPIHSLQLGVDNREESKPEQKYLSIRGPALGNQPDAPGVTDDVHALYRRLFSEGATGGMNSAEVERMRMGRRSLLDFVGGDLARFARNLGTESRQKVDSHLESIRSLEKQLDNIAVLGPYKPLPNDASINPNSKDDYDKIARAHVELITGAFATGQTRVATLLMSNGHNNSWVFKWLGGDYGQAGTGEFGSRLRSHHEMAHQGDGDAAQQRRKNGIDKYFISLFALMMERFKTVPEGTGTMLDNSVILCGSNMGNGGSHSNDRLPWILGGSCGGYFRTGRYVKQSGGTPHNQVLVAMSNAMGVPGGQFSNLRGVNYGGELPGLR